MLGLKFADANQSITAEQKHLLLDYLKSNHTAAQPKDSVASGALTLKRKKTIADAPAASKNIISVTVRKRRAYDADKELAEEKRLIEEKKRKALESKLLAEQRAKAEQEQIKLSKQKGAAKQSAAQTAAAEPEIKKDKPRKENTVVVQPKKRTHIEIKRPVKKGVRAASARHRDKSKK